MAEKPTIDIYEAMYRSAKIQEAREIAAMNDRLVRDLRNGDTYAEGWRVQAGDKPKLERIKAEQWDYLKLDFDEGTARGGGIEYVGVKLWEATGPAPRQIFNKKAECIAWLREQTEKPRTKERTVEALKAEAMNRFDLKDRAWRRLWDEFKKNPPAGCLLHASWIAAKGPAKSS